MGERTYKSVPVDVQKFKAELVKRNMTMADVSRSFGFSENYLSGCLKRGSIPVPTSRLLEITYQIKPQDYEPERPLERLTAPCAIDYDRLEDAFRSALPEPNYDLLYNVIFNAVYSAVKKAWSE